MKPIFIFVIFFTVSSAYGQERFSIVINEIMADPTPTVNLPPIEWIELYNKSGTAINIQGWKIGDGNSLSGPLPNYLLKADSFVIICSASSITALSVYGPALSVSSFPSLDNDGDLVFLRSGGGKTIHAISFTPAWYKNALKEAGGWTLEIIDPNSPCVGIENWSASNDIKGGTPGKINSVKKSNPDPAAPRLVKSWGVDSLNIILHFSEQVDSNSAALVSNYKIEGIAITAAYPQPPLFTTVKLTLANLLIPNRIYELTAENIQDCNNNVMTTSFCKTGISTEPLENDCVINEILFNPRSNAYDFVELFNASQKILDASKLFIANRGSSGAIANIKSMTTTPHLIFPGDHIVITENSDNLALNYLLRFPENILELTSLPSYPDEEGCVIIMNSLGQVIDEVNYKDDWHFKLLNDQEGVSLERTNPLALSNSGGTWHSAASTAGFATPGYKNSQQIDQASPGAEISISPRIISPDNDGNDDIATIHYKIDEPGYVANIFIFDLAGRLVRQLEKNSLMGLNGYWTWDGLNDKNQQPDSGIYIIVTEIFNLQGRKKIFRNKVVIGYRE
jgi:hypothetical protein